MISTVSIVIVHEKEKSINSSLSFLWRSAHLEFEQMLSYKQSDKFNRIVEAT